MPPAVSSLSGNGPGFHLRSSIFFSLFHLPGFLLDTGSWLLTAALMGFLLPLHLASRLVVGWLDNAADASVLIACCSTPCTTP